MSAINATAAPSQKNIGAGIEPEPMVGCCVDGPKPDTPDLPVFLQSDFGMDDIIVGLFRRIETRPVVTLNRESERQPRRLRQGWRANGESKFILRVLELQ
jgi:hypothetical protein